MVVMKHLDRHCVVRSMPFLYDALVSPHGKHAWLYGLRCLSPKYVPRGYLLAERMQPRPGRWRCFALHVASATTKACMDVVLLVPRFH